MNNIKPLPIFKRWSVQSVTALIVAILVPIAVNWLGWNLQLKEQIAIGASIWVVGMIFQIALSVQSLHVEQLEFKYVLDAINDHDRVLMELQTNFRKMLSRNLSGLPNRVFVEYCRRNLAMSLEVVKGAAERGEMKVHDHHFETIGTVMAAFKGCKDRTFRCVWLIERGDSLFDTFWAEYMKSLVELSRRKNPNKRVDVSILFVSDDEDQLRRKSVEQVFQFVTQERRFEFRVIFRDKYKEILRDNRLDSEYLDYGIYGNHLLFRTLSFDPNVGVFTDDTDTVNKFSMMHDKIMTSREKAHLDHIGAKLITLPEFLRSDDLDDHSSS